MKKLIIYNSIIFEKICFPKNIYLFARIKHVLWIPNYSSAVTACIIDWNETIKAYIRHTIVEFLC